MVDKVITKQELIDAKRDARDLGKAVNEKVIVSPRYGEDFKSIPMVAEEFQDAIEAAAAAGAGANGWIDSLVLTQDGSNQRAKNSSFQSQIDSKASAAYVDAQDAVKADKSYVDTALSNLSTTANKFYPTLAEANYYSTTMAVNDVVTIGEEANKGLWYKATAGATTLTKSAYDPLTQAKADATVKANAAKSEAIAAAATDATTKANAAQANAIAAITSTDEVKFLYDLYDVGGKDIQKLLAERYYTAERFLYTNTGVMRVTTTNRNAYVTNYHAIDPDANEIVVSGWSIGGSTALYAFYDSGYVCLSAPAGKPGGLQVKTILKEDIPENAKYIRYTGWKGGDSYIIGAVPIVSVSATEALFYDILSKKSVDRLRALAEIDTSTLGFFIQMDTGAFTKAAATPLLTASDFLVLDKSVDTLTVSGRGIGTIALFAIYDINKNVLMTSLGSGTGNHTYSVDMSTLPPESHYIRFTGWQGYDGFVQGIIEPTLIEDIAQIVVNLTPPPSISHKLNSIFITGASFTHSGNTWFSEANKKLGTTGINKARNGAGKPSADALFFWRGTMMTDEEFEDIDVFSFMYANVHNLDSEVGLKEKAEDYTASFDLDAVGNPFTTYSEAQCMDYILRYLQEKCYAQKDNPDSKWFGTQHGKPFNVMFVTSWHDGRPYNSIPVRVLAAKWGAAVCELDKKIGFSKDRTLPDGVQVSTIYAQDTEVVDGITYGWHPKRDDSSQYIQNKIATIYKQSIIEYFGD